MIGLFFIGACIVGLACGHGNMIYPPVFQDNVNNPVGLDLSKVFKNHGGFIGCGKDDPANGVKISCVVQWYNNNTKLPDGQAVTLPEEMSAYRPYWVGRREEKPWMAPGTAHVWSPCGVSGGNPEGCPIGDKNSDTCPGGGHAFGAKAEEYFSNRAVPQTKWPKGSAQNVAFTLLANHGGGYQYRLCKVGSSGRAGVTEECFEKLPLSFVGSHHHIAWDSDSSKWMQIPAKDTSEGTYPAGSVWRRNPIPACAGYHGGFSNEDNSCPDGTQFTAPGVGLHGFSITHRNNFDNLFKWSVVDQVRVPGDLDLGEYVLSWRWDNEQTNQIWNTCSSIIVTDTECSGKGSYENAAGECIVCPANTYKTETDSECISCPADTFSAAGSASLDDCKTEEEEEEECGFETLNNVAYWGNDLVNGMQNKVGSSDACEGQCEARSDCVGYSWVAADGDYKNTCWLKHDISDKRDIAGVVSGYLKARCDEEEDDDEEDDDSCGFETQDSVAYWYGDLVDGLSNKVGSAGICEDQCRLRADCIGYSWVSIDGDYKNSCWLKNNLDDKRPTTGVTSGVLKSRCEEDENNSGDDEEEEEERCSFEIQANTAYWNGDILNGLENKQDSSEDCGKECKNTATCIGYSFVSIDGDYKNSCWLKNNLDDKRDYAQVESGVLKCKEEEEGDGDEEEGEEGEDDKEEFCAWVTEENTAYEGGEAGATTKVKNTQKCAKSCTENENCKAYSFVLTGKKGKCYLLTDVTDRSDNTKATSAFYKCSTESKMLESNEDAEMSLPHSFDHEEEWQYGPEATKHFKLI